MGSTTLVLLEMTDVGIHPLSLRALSAARSVSQSAVGVVLGKTHTLAERACEYFQRVIHVPVREMTAETVAPILCEIMEQSKESQLVAAATPFSRDVLPRAAALLGASFLSQLSEIQPHGQGKRAVLAGKGFVSTRSLRPTVLITVEPSAFAVALPLLESGVIQLWEGTMEGNPTVTIVQINSAAKEGPSLSDATVVLGVGRGVGPVDSVPAPLLELAEMLGAAVGGTRATCDSGLFPGDLQIGQTGRIIAPDCYVAVGVSGAVQHVAGIRCAGLIVAIDKNELAPIFEIADVGWVGTWETLVPQLCSLLHRQ